MDKSVNKRQPMPIQDANIRNSNFDEVTLGYSAEQAIAEAKRCLLCKTKPCVKKCPVCIDIPAFIEKVAQGQFEGAYEIVAKSSSLPAVCGRVCPQEVQCEQNCTRGIKGEAVAIGRLERFVADYHIAHYTDTFSVPTHNGHKIAVIGSGPSGLTCAGDLAKMGYPVTIFEALHVAGGVLVYGIPEFRLPKKIVSVEIEMLKSLGVKIETNVVVGKTVTIPELLNEFGFEAVFIGSGAGLPKFMKIPGENLGGVYSANEFLTRVNLMKAYKEDSQTPIYCGNHVVVVGGGNVAMDAARCAKRIGADVTVVYRRDEKELPARREEVEHAKEEGINFNLLTNPCEIFGDDEYWVKAVRCQKIALGEPDDAGRAKPYPIEGSEFEIPADCVIMSLGTTPNPLLKSATEGLETEWWGGIIVDEKTCKTSLDKVYAGGDAVSGSATVILAMEMGKVAAKAIDADIKSR